MRLRGCPWRTSSPPAPGCATGHRRNIETDGDALTLSVAGETNVELRFEPLVEVPVKGGLHRVERTCFFADDPRAACRVLSAQAVSSAR